MCHYLYLENNYHSFFFLNDMFVWSLHLNPGLSKLIIVTYCLSSLGNYMVTFNYNFNNDRQLHDVWIWHADILIIHEAKLDYNHFRDKYLSFESSLLIGLHPSSTLILTSHTRRLVSFGCVAYVGGILFTMKANTNHDTFLCVIICLSLEIITPTLTTYLPSNN